MPERLFKYQQFNAYTQANLKDRILWFSPPVRFNDPFDCAQPFLKSELSEEESDRAFEWVCKSVGRREPVEKKFKIDGRFTDGFRDTILKLVRDAFEERKRIHTQERGVACLTEVNTDLLMWAHYADGHRGFCLEFDPTADPFSTARKVVYHEALPVVRAADLLDGGVGNPDIFEPMILTKADCWAYEQEWRIIHMQANTAYTYPWSALKAIYFGAAMPEVQMEILAMVLRDSPTTLYRMVRSQTCFGVESQVITYTPFRYE